MRAGRGAGARTSGEAWPVRPFDPGSFRPRTASTQPPPSLGSCRRTVSGQAAGCGKGGSSRWVSFGAGSAVRAPLVCSSRSARLAQGPVGSAVGGSGPGLCGSLTRLPRETTGPAASPLPRLQLQVGTESAETWAVGPAETAPSGLTAYRRRGVGAWPEGPLGAGRLSQGWLLLGLPKGLAGKSCRRGFEPSGAPGGQAARGPPSERPPRAAPLLEDERVTGR